MLLVKMTQIGLQPNMPRATFNRVLRESWTAPTTMWHREMMPLHFTRAGARKYSYLPRRGEEKDRQARSFRRSYSGRKLRLFGHMDPLVFTGRTRALARQRDIRTTSKGGRVVLHTPALNFRPTGGRINLRAEATRITPDEEQKLVRAFDAKLEGELNYRGHTVTRTVAAGS